jgi:hypothetical protein
VRKEEDPHPNLPPQGGKEQEARPSSFLLPSPLAGEGLGMGGYGKQKVAIMAIHLEEYREFLEK